MLHTTVVVYADEGRELKAEAEVDLNDLLPPEHGLMPVSFTGKLLNLTERDKEAVRTAKNIEMLFAGTDMRYEAIVDRETFRFRVVDTSEHGV